MKLCSIVFMAALFQGGSPGEQRELLEAIAIGYESNLAKMPFATIEMDHADGYASTPAAARSGDIRHMVVAKCRYQFRGDDRLFIREFEPEDLDRTRGTPSGKGYHSRVNSVRALTDGTQTIVEVINAGRIGDEQVSKQFRGVGMHNGVRPFRQNADIPLDLGLPEELRAGLGLSLRRLLDDDGTNYWLNAIEEDDGQGVTRIEIGFPEGTMTYWVDMERGCLPIRSLSDARGSRVDDSYEDIRLVDGVAYYPFVSTSHFSGKVRQNRVTAMDLTTPPAAESFRLEFLRPITITNGDAGVKYPSRAVWNFASLPSANSPSVTRYDRMPAPPEPQPGEREPGPSVAMLGAVAVAVALVVGVGGIWLRRRG